MTANFTRRQFLKTCGVVSASTLGASLVAETIIRPTLKAGAARRRITPPISIPYLTSSGNGTHAPFQGVHCDLFARALVLDDGKKPMAVLSVDSIGYDNTILGRGRHFTNELRARIAARTKLQPGAIMLAATHAHSTPETIGLTSFRDVEGAAPWLENHLAELVETMIDAWQHREPVFAFSGRGKVEGIARHRRILLKNGKQSRHGPLPALDEVAIPGEMDEDLSVIYFRKLDGSAHSVLLNYTAHPVVAMVLPRVCADYPGVAAELVEKSLPGAICLFTQGAAGNVNSIHVSTNYGDVEKLGRKLGQAALSQVADFRPNDLVRHSELRFQSTTLTLTPRPCPSLHDAERAMWSQPSAANQRLFRLARKLKEDSLQVEIQAMRLGGIKWISLPGEPFVETGLALKRAGASFVIGYANGWHGYFPIRRAYDEGGYETEVGAWSRVAPGSAEQLESTAKKLIQSLV